MPAAAPRLPAAFAHALFASGTAFRSSRANEPATSCPSVPRKIRLRLARHRAPQRRPCPACAARPPPPPRRTGTEQAAAAKPPPEFSSVFSSYRPFCEKGQHLFEQGRRRAECEHRPASSTFAASADWPASRQSAARMRTRTAMPTTRSTDPGQLCVEIAPREQRGKRCIVLCAASPSRSSKTTPAASTSRNAMTGASLFERERQHEREHDDAREQSGAAQNPEHALHHAEQPADLLDDQHKYH